MSQAASTSAGRQSLNISCAFSLSAVFVTARAEASPTWTLPINEKVTVSLPVELSVKVEKALSFSTKIAGAAVTVSCAEVTPDKALLEAEGKSTGTLLFSSCQTSINGVLSESCKPFSKGLTEGSIASLALKGQLVVHEAESLQQIKPVTGENFAVIEYKPPCALPEKSRSRAPSMPGIPTVRSKPRKRRTYSNRER